MQQQPYPIGTAGKKWDESEKKQWLLQQKIQRSYQDEVLSVLAKISDDFVIEQYGALSYDSERYPLFLVKSAVFNSTKPSVLITGGVHGYETSGVQGALAFLLTKAKDYCNHFNILVAPCVSPWGYETINRWDPLAIDPNRSFYKNSPAEEAALLMQAVAPYNENILAHIDLHETTDTDNSEFRPALAARDGVEHNNWNIPDGFYLVGDSENPQHDFQAAIIEQVKQVTHIALADEQGKLIGVKTSQFGVVNYANKALGLCAGLTDATYVTTTEVYPDSDLVDDNNCIQAQVAAVTGGLDYVLTQIK